ncbi:hypothetical protein SBA3_520021 [Candidatus Sulfopaludibacter sp. SbA3]|nr:hypothetical protein SBA3_520021 [Candidatus Sulfopaludibacter sp. SbA3]
MIYRWPPIKTVIYTPNASQLKLDGIIFTRERTLRSLSIQAGTFFKSSHAMLYIAHYSFIDSDSHGVHPNNLGRLLFRSSGDFCVKRLKKPLDAGTMLQICRYARAEVG